MQSIYRESSQGMVVYIEKIKKLLDGTSLEKIEYLSWNMINLVSTIITYVRLATFEAKKEIEVIIANHTIKFFKRNLK